VAFAGFLTLTVGQLPGRRSFLVAVLRAFPFSCATGAGVLSARQPPENSGIRTGRFWYSAASQLSKWSRTAFPPPCGWRVTVGQRVLLVWPTNSGSRKSTDTSAQPPVNQSSRVDGGGLFVADQVRHYALTPSGSRTETARGCAFGGGMVLQYDWIEPVRDGVPVDRHSTLPGAIELLAKVDVCRQKGCRRSRSILVKRFVQIVRTGRRESWNVASCGVSPSVLGSFPANFDAGKQIGLGPCHREQARRLELERAKMSGSG